jgi:hypothetical protein
MKIARYTFSTIAIFACFVFPHAGNAIAQTDKEHEIKRIYKQLIDAENKHDLAAVRKLVWNSSSTLFVAKAPVGWHGFWGIDDVMQHLHDMYQQPFRIDPIYEEEKAVFITPEIAETYAPVRITVAYGGQNRSQAVCDGVDLDPHAAGLENGDRYSDSGSTRSHNALTLNLLKDS